MTTNMNDLMTAEMDNFKMNPIGETIVEVTFSVSDWDCEDGALMTSDYRYYTDSASVHKYASMNWEDAVARATRIVRKHAQTH